MVCPSVISVADAPGSYRCAMAAPVVTTHIARTARNTLQSIRLSSLDIAAASGNDP
jgi:hypothetical protein